MKQKLLASVLLLGSVLSTYADEYMVVELNNGETYSFLLADRPVITYESASLVINSNANTSYAIENIKEYHFSNLNAKSVDISVHSMRIVNIDEETIEVQNAKPLASVCLSSVNGAKTLSSYIGTDGKVVVKLPQSKGIYVLSVDGNSFKIIRK